MRLLRTCCVCQCRRSNSNAHRKRRRRRKSQSSERESVSGSETGGAVAEQRRTEAVDQRARRTSSGGGSKRRQRATYRYEVVYRREEFSHDYLDHPEAEDGHLPAVFRPVPEGQPSESQGVAFQSADYSLLSNYGRLEDFHPPALHTAVHSWQQQQQHSSYDDQPLYQNFGGGLTKDLREYLTTRFAKGSVDHELQTTIRDNLYLRTVPVTTRPRRPGETDGLDYTFLSLDQFRLLEKNGSLLERGIYDGNYYGTPKPALDSPLVLPSTPLAQSSTSALVQQQHNNNNVGGGGSLLLLAGAHPSSEGKRRRNRSNVEAMAAAQNDGDADPNSGMDHSSMQQQHLNASQRMAAPICNNSIGGSNNNMSIPSYREDGGGAMGGLSEAELGPLPQNWEKAYTERGEVYFIDHNTGTSQWLDPRLSKIQKKSLEECAEDELPYGWEKIDDPTYGTYYIDHVNRKTQYENPVTQAKKGGSGGAANETSSPPAPPGTSGLPTGNASSTDSGNSTYPRLKKQQQQQQQSNESAGGGGGHNGNNQPPAPLPKRSNSYNRPFFTRNPSELQGERICTTLLKSNRGLGFTIVGGDDSEEEFLQIKSVVPHGPAWVDGRLQTGDVLVYVMDQCVLGYTHHDMVNMFQSIAPGQAVALEVCRGYPLPFDPNDPNTEIVTTVAVAQQDGGNKPSRPGSADLLMQGSEHHQDNNDMAHRFDGDEYGDGGVNGNPSSASNKVEFLTVQITKGAMGFGFTIADSAYGQKVKTILDRPRCKNLQEGDILVDINGINMRHMSHGEVVQVLKDCAWGREASITVQRGGAATPTKNKWKKGGVKDQDQQQPPVSPRKPPVGAGLFRSKTPTADLYSAQTKEVVPIRPKTPLVDTRNRPKTPSMGVAMSSGGAAQQSDHLEQHREINRTPVNALADQFQNGMNFQENNGYNNQQQQQQRNVMNRSRSPGRELDTHPTSMQMHYENGLPPDAGYMPNGYPPAYESDYGSRMGQPPRNPRADPYAPNPYTGGSYSMDASRPMDYGYGYSGMNGPNVPDYPEENLGQFHRQDSGYGTQPQSVVVGYSNNSGNSGNNLLRQNAGPGSYAPLKEGTSFDHDLSSYPPSMSTGRPDMRRPSNNSGNGNNANPPVNSSGQQSLPPPGEWMEMNVTLLRHETGFGFRIVGGTEEGSQVSIGHIVPGGAADLDGRLRTGDEILAVDMMSVVHTSHHHVVQLMGAAALNGRVSISVRRWIPLHSSSMSPQDAGYPSGVGDGGGMIYPYDVTVVRREDEGFGFVIISSVTKGVSFIGQIIPDSPAKRCSQLHVGDRILAVNHHDISRLHHGDIVNLIKDSGYTVTLTVGPPLDDTASSNASNSHRSSDAMVTAQALPAPPASDGGTRSPSRDAYHQQYVYSQEDQIDGPMIDGSEAYPPIEEDQLYAVELSRGTRGFGFSIRGGREFHNMPLFVLRIADNGAAAQDGRLRVGDQLIEINGINTKNMTHADAIELIKNGGMVVRLLLRRGNAAPPMGENGQMLSPSSTGSPTTPSGMMEMMRPNSSMAQPHHGSYGSNGPLSQLHQTDSRMPNGIPVGHQQQPPPQQQQQQYTGPPPYMMGPRGMPNGGMRGHVPAPLNVPPIQRNLNGPLSHSSPRVIGAAGNVGGDYYWGS
ncbi:membrane-associated guanylate kinase, WW and PDZ domain-containing protein 1-like isoform X1 [Daphnia carinata]|uniref:membrane-associated guanylate kinase, WW and PDZ domain-containing protein 1-like isoform X1 n=1 Tax=Daphnia carinata TaxID=120202 RepID=UPI00257A3921|nr:membrane-associated guanylate kinase, WW and PDZ domain-containing protein 1-like isoform X1 [Daphnia carinata]